MSILDTAEDIGRSLAVEGIGALAKYLVHKFAGDDNDAKERIARKAIEAATEQAKNEAFMLAGGTDVIVAQLEDIATRAGNVLAAFSPTTKPIIEYQIAAELTAESWEKLKRAIGGAGIVEPSKSEREDLGAVAVVNDTVIVIADEDRNVPVSIRALIESAGDA